MTGALGDIAQRVFPIEARRQHIAFDITSAGKAHEGGVQIVDIGSQVGAQSIGSMLEGIGGKQGDRIQPERTRTCCRKGRVEQPGRPRLT